MVAYLVLAKRITKQMSPLPAFQVCLSFLAETDFSSVVADFSSGTMLKRSDTDYGRIERTVGNDDLWGSNRASAVLLHPVDDQDAACGAQYNALWRLSASAMADLKDFASVSLRTLQQLDTDREASISNVFLKRSIFFERFDVLIHFPVCGATAGCACAPPRDASTESVTAEEDRSSPLLAADEGGDLTPWQRCSVHAVQLVQRALGDRARLVRSYPLPFSSGSNPSDVHSTVRYSIPSHSLLITRLS